MTNKFDTVGLLKTPWKVDVFQSKVKPFTANSSGCSESESSRNSIVWGRRVSR